ncbi:MAG: flagellar assembly protein FliH [Curvibacter sp.]|nr:flagellar assembly protein FliH [Curvibacter sp.]
MTTASSKARQYARFIPSEEIDDFSQWQFGEVDEERRLAALAMAEQEAEAVAPDPELMQKAWDEAYQRGLAQGRTEGRLEGQRALDAYVADQGAQARRGLEQLMQGLQSNFTQLEQEVAQSVLEMACSLARQVVRQELATRPELLAGVVREALGMLTADSRVATVRLCPQDHERFVPDLKEALAEPGLRWLPDPALSAGDCMVEAAGAEVDGRLSRRWSRAIAALGLERNWEEPSHGDD